MQMVSLRMVSGASGTWLAVRRMESDASGTWWEVEGVFVAREGRSLVHLVEEVQVMYGDVLERQHKDLGR